MTIQDYLSKRFTGVNDNPFASTKKVFKKGDIITKTGEVEDHLYFLNKGAIQIALKCKDDVRIIDFGFPGNWFNAYDSFLERKPSDVVIEALTDTEVECISYAEMQVGYSNSLFANFVGRCIVEEILMPRIKKEREILSKTAEERYFEMLQQRRDLCVNLPVNKIAKYLGIHPESLSRIRKKTRFTN
jgi:CRP-like cAMP-binding protein